LEGFKGITCEKSKTSNKRRGIHLVSCILVSTICCRNQGCLHKMTISCSIHVKKREAHTTNGTSSIIVHPWGYNHKLVQVLPLWNNWIMVCVWRNMACCHWSWLPPLAMLFQSHKIWSPTISLFIPMVEL
jgi:hypothetical protein